MDLNDKDKNIQNTLRAKTEQQRCDEMNDAPAKRD